MSNLRSFRRITGIILIVLLMANTSSAVFAADDSGQAQTQGNSGSAAYFTDLGDTKNAGNTGTAQPGDNPGSGNSEVVPGDSDNPGGENPGDSDNPGDSENPGDSDNPGDGDNPGEGEKPEPKPLEKPEFTRHTVTKGYYLQLEWTSVEHAAKYVIQRKTPGSTVWKTIATYSADKTKRTGTGKLAEGKYTYRVKAVSEAPELYTDTISDEVSVFYLGATQATVTNVKGRVRVDWTPVNNATGYYVYRKHGEADQWTYIKTVYGINSTSFYDNGASDGTDIYAIKAFSGSNAGVDRSIGAYGTEGSISLMGHPKTVSFTSEGGGVRLIKWSAAAGAEGYELSFGRNRLFIGGETVILGADSLSYSAKGYSSSESFFARVRAFRTVNGEKEYSGWQHCQNSGKTGYATYERVEYGAGGFDIKGRAGQSLYAYDTVQGGCTDGTYAYYALNNRTVDNCKIVKIRLSDSKVMKVSGVLSLDHGNGIAYDPDRNELVVNNCTRNPKRLTVVDPVTLTVKRKTDVSIPPNMLGASSGESTGITGFSSITYNQSRGVYVALTKGKSGFLIMDGNFKVIEYMPLTYKTTGKLWQCLDSTDDYLLIAHSPNGNSGNIIAVYDWEGRYVTDIKLPSSYELENIYNTGTVLYATYYVNGYSSGQHYRRNYIYKFDLNEERAWVKACVSKPTKPYAPKKPTALKPKASAKTASVKLVWNKASFGAGYEIYRSENKKGDYQLIKKTTTLDTVSYTDKGLKRKTTYYYKIRTYKTSYGKTYYSPYTTVKTVKTL